MFVQVGIYVVFEVWVRFNAIDLFDKRGIITMNLISRPGAQFENNAASGSYERRNNGCVFISDKIASFA